MPWVDRPTAADAYLSRMNLSGATDEVVYSRGMWAVNPFRCPGTRYASVISPERLEEHTSDAKTYLVMGGKTMFEAALARPGRIATITLCVLDEFPPLVQAPNSPPQSYHYFPRMCPEEWTHRYGYRGKDSKWDSYTMESWGPAKRGNIAQVNVADLSGKVEALKELQASDASDASDANEVIQCDFTHVHEDC